MVELADTPDLGSGAVRRTGSSPAIRTRLSLDAGRVPGLAFSFIYSSRPSGYLFHQYFQVESLDAQVAFEALFFIIQN